MENNFLYKYRSFSENTDKIIKNTSLYLSPIEKFNDPFDSKLSYKQCYTTEEIQKYWEVFLRDKEPKTTVEQAMENYGISEKFVERQNLLRKDLETEIGVLSLSKTSTSILMWSHYANNHTGLVFEFEPKYATSCLAKPIKVDYEISYDVLSYVVERKVREEQYIKELLTKFVDWSYEKEYRVIEINFQGEKEFHKDELKSIIFGLKAKTTDMDNMIKLCHENGFSHVKFKKAEAVHGKFELAIRDL